MPKNTISAKTLSHFVRHTTVFIYPRPRKAKRWRTTQLPTLSIINIESSNPSNLSNLTSHCQPQ